METPEEPRQNHLAEELSTLKDALLGLTALNQDTVLLDYGHVIVRRNYHQLTTVRLLSGGIAGTDLSYATFVGKGMLTAAVLGDEVAPSSRLVLRTIDELSQGENCGIFVIARVGAELYNLSLAVQRVSAACRTRVKLLNVNDIRTSVNATCGFIILMKIMGAMAEAGVFFTEMWERYKTVAEQIVSVPVHYQHFEQLRTWSRDRVSLCDDFDCLYVSVIDKKSVSSLHLHPSIPIVVLINTPKALEKSAETVLVKQVIQRLRHLGVCVARVYSGNFVSMRPCGASLTVLKVFDDKFIEYMDAPCEAVGWQQVTRFHQDVTLNNEVPGLLSKHGKQEIPLKGPRLPPHEVDILVKSLQFACEALISCERQLNIIDEEKSNGNVGTRFKKFADHLKKRLHEKRIDIDCPFAFFKKLSVIVEACVSGTLGSIYGVMFDKAADVFGDSRETITADTWTRALTEAEKAVDVGIGEDRGIRTMYFPLKICQLAIVKHTELEVMERFGLGVSQAEEAAQMTRAATDVHPDAGAHAVGIWMRAVYEGVKLMYQGYP